MRPAELLALIDSALTSVTGDRRYPTLDDYSAALELLRRRSPTPRDERRSTMATTTDWKIGDRCPNDGGELRPVPAPTEKERAMTRDRDNPTPLRPGVDTATEQQVAELGNLYRCASCGYQS